MQKQPEYYRLTAHMEGGTKDKSKDCIFIGRVYRQPEDDGVHVSVLMTPDEVVVWKLEGGETDD